MAIEVLRETVARCEQAGVPLLPVKGVVTGRWLYEDVAERPIVDVDVRIRPEDFSTVRGLGQRAGWRCSKVIWTYRSLVYEFVPLSLDVESYVGPPGLCALEVGTMMARATLREIAPGLRVRVPELHDHCVLLVVNAFKDKLSTARQGALADLERIVCQPDFRQEVLVERLVEARVATLAWVVASWMETQRGSARWGALRAALETRTRTRRRYARLFANWAIEHSGSMRLRLLARAAADGRSMRVHALGRAAAWQVETWLRALFQESGGSGERR
jgi:hypothetical protein